MIKETGISNVRIKMIRRNFPFHVSLLHLYPRNNPTRITMPPRRFRIDNDREVAIRVKNMPVIIAAIQ